MLPGRWFAQALTAGAGSVRIHFLLIVPVWVHVTPSVAVPCAKNQRAQE